MSKKIPVILPVYQQTIMHIEDNMTSLSSDRETPTASSNTTVKQEYFKIRFAYNAEHRQSATILVEKQYKSQGYEVNKVEVLDISKPNRITLLVHNKNNKPIGTITIGPDGPEGLMADSLYRDTLDEMRVNNMKLLELTKFAMERHRGNSIQVLASIFNVAYIYTKQLGCNWMIVEVNPRHVNFYEKNLGFKVIGPERICPRVNASAVLLGLDLSYAVEQRRKFAGKQADNEAGKSFYRFFLTEEEESGLANRLFGDK